MAEAGNEVISSIQRNITSYIPSTAEHNHTGSEPTASHTMTAIPPAITIGRIIATGMFAKRK